MVNLLLSDLQNKDIISINGANLGRIIDVEVNDEGKIIKIIAEQRSMYLRFFKNEEIEFKYEDIIKIGSDVILINH
ncbi:MAG: YlmC/YmxH family sporulation protein [Firmicutes bacterium]|nr:YlmC/YmxH family sporulation protein [Bacillota bacterium]